MASGVRTFEVEKKGERAKSWEPAPQEAWEDIENDKRRSLNLRISESSSHFIPYFEYIRALPTSTKLPYLFD